MDIYARTGFDNDVVAHDNGSRREVGLVSDYDKTVFFHLLTTERFVCAKLDQQLSRARSASGRLTSKMRTTASGSHKTVEERHEKRSCSAVPHGRVSDCGRRESKLETEGTVNDGDGPSFLKSRIHLV